MAGLRHPLSGAVYDVMSDSTIQVATDESWGRFDRHGVWIEGDLRHCDPQMCNWLASGTYELATRRPSAYTQEDSE